MIGWGLELAEQGLVPLPLLRVGIGRLLRDRLIEAKHLSQEGLAGGLSESPIAVETAAANDQHYALPPRFFELVLGPHLKYSAGYWPNGVTTLAESERAALELVCERADLRDGQTVLDLGCGWGSLSRFAAERFPRSTVVGVSNSAVQRQYIMRRPLANLSIITADVNQFDPGRRFDRIVSIEMLEHVRNYAALFARIRSWLEPEGRMFAHIFCHREFAYPFETRGDDNWMGRYFFTGGLMPSFQLFRTFDRDLSIEAEWSLDGSHYQRTARAWRENLERRRDEVLAVFAGVYGAQAGRWYQRWRLFFLACEELFGFRRGTEWMVGHYRFRRA